VTDERYEMEHKRVHDLEDEVERLRVDLGAMKADRNRWRDENERLREDVKSWKETYESAVEHYKAQDINRLHQENGRLREALADISDDARVLIERIGWWQQALAEEKE
jgi:archaellum component FlaC